MPEGKNNLIELYKITRASVEHFDKLLGDLRKIMLGFDSVIIAAVLANYGEEIIKAGSPSINRTILKFLFNGSFIFTITNILFWGLEKHYHRYLMISAKIAEKLEEKICNDKALTLTYQLRQIRNYPFDDKSIPKIITRWIYKVSRYIRSYDLLYIFPIMISVGLNLYLADRLADYRLWSLSKLMFVICTLLSYIIIRRDHLLTECCIDTISGKNGKVKDDQMGKIKAAQSIQLWFLKGFAAIVSLAGISFIISVLRSSTFNTYAKFFVNFSIGLFLLICGRGIWLQKNLAREIFRWAFLILAIVVVSILKYSDDIKLSLFFAGLCGGIFYYLSRHKTKELFIRYK